MARHELTREERSKGAQTTNDARRRQRDEREQAADERFAQMLDKAFGALERMLDSDTPDRAVREVFDRYLGRPSQRIEHEGEVAHTLDARPRLAALLADRSARAGTKKAD